MKRRDALGLSLAAPVILRAAAAGSLASQILPRWETGKKFTLAFLEKMPEEHYNFKPVPEINSFAQQAAHIAEGNYLLASAVNGLQKPQEAPKELTRATLSRFVATSFDYAAAAIGALSDRAADEVVPFFNEKLSKRTLCLRLLDHAAHHRGQMVIYLRLKGIVPPEYPG